MSSPDDYLALSPLFITVELLIPFGAVQNLMLYLHVYIRQTAVDSVRR